MSLVLMFIYWVAIPVFALYAGRGLLRRAGTNNDGYFSLTQASAFEHHERFFTEGVMK